MTDTPLPQSVTPSLDQAIQLALQQAVACHQAGQLQQAEQLYRTILKSQPQHPDANHNLGVLAIQSQQPANSLPLFEAAIAASPGVGQYWVSYIDALIKTQQHEAARQVLAHARQQGLQGVAVDALVQQLTDAETVQSDVAPYTARTPKPPRKPASHRRAGPGADEINALVALFNQGRYAEMETAARRLLVEHPDYGIGWKALGTALLQQGRMAEVLEPMQKAAAFLPGDAEVRNSLGNVLRQQGALPEAEASYRMAVKLKPDYAEAHSNLGVVIQEQGRFAEAESCHRQALKLRPDNAQAHSNLGNVLREQERLAEAETSYHRALAINPGYAEAYNNLAVIQHMLGRPAEAESNYRQALALRPDYVEAHYNLGTTLHELGQLPEAESCYRRALAFKPDYAEACNNLANTLKDQNRLIEAEDCYRQALKIDPHFVEAHSNLGRLLNDQGRYAEAEASLHRALELMPDYTDAWVTLGRMVADRGQFAEAETLFRRALSIDPEMPEAWAGIANVRKMTPADADWLETAEQLVRQYLPPRQEAALRYAMGKYCDDVKDFDRAFLNYRRANELKKSSGTVYDRQNQTQVINQLIQFYHRERVHQVLDGSSASERPLFIVGMMRSGTSLTEQIIASHPAAFGAGELLFWPNAASRYEPALLGGELNIPMLQGLAQDYLQNLGSFSTEALRVADKMPGNFLHLGLIHAVFPHARILHTQRNPVDTCLSIYFQNFDAHSYANDLDDLAHHYREYHRLMAHWRAVLPPEVFLDVPYEALVEDQEGWSRRIIEFIGLEWDDACLNFHETERKVGTASNWQVRQRIYKSSKERWRNYEKHVCPLLELLELP